MRFRSRKERIDCPSNVNHAVAFVQQVYTDLIGEINIGCSSTVSAKQPWNS